MLIREVRSSRDVLDCVEIYSVLNDGYIPHDREQCIKSMHDFATRKFARVAEDEGEIIAFICAAEIKLPHSRCRIFQQFYYASNQSGFKSAKCVKSLHDAMYKEACILGCDYATSPGSCYDENNVFAKLLERCGWERRGYMALKEVPF